MTTPKKVSAPIRLAPEMIEKVAIAAQKMGRSQAEVLRLALEVGLEDLGRCDFDLAKVIVDQAKPDSVTVSNVTDFPKPATTYIPFYGAVAAGQPVTSQRDGETLEVPGNYDPARFFVVEINGQSAEPDFQDGDRWVIDAKDSGGTPAHGKPCVVSDGYGSYLKKFNRKSGMFESINPKFSDVLPVEGATFQGYPVKKV